MSDLYVKQSDLDVISDKLKGYQKAIEQIEQSIEEFKQIVQDGEGEAINALKEITEKQGNINLEEYKERVNQLSKTFIEYNDEFFSNEVKPQSRGEFTELDRNDIWANLLSIEWAEGHIQDGINEAWMPFVDNGKNKTVVDEAVARTNSFLATIKNLRGELWNQFKKIEHIDDTDKGYQSRIKNELGQFASFWDNLTAAFEQVGNFLNGVKDSIIGLVEGLVSLVGGLFCLVLNIAWLGVGALYGAITGDWRLKDMCSDELGKTFKVVETIINDPWLLVEGIGQQYNDGVNEKGVAYGVGMLVGDFLPELVGAGAVSVTGKIKYTKVITALEKVGVVVDVEKVIAKFGSESKFLKYVDEFGGEAKFTELVKNAGGIDELTRLVDEAGGIEKFLSAVEEAGGVERYVNLKQVDNIINPNYSETGVEHTFKGEVKTRQSGKEIIGGGHYEPTLNTDVTIKFREPEPPKYNEPYKALQETKNGTQERKTMFPRNWTPEQVDEAIQYVYKNGTFDKNKNLTTGTFNNMEITIYLNNDKKIISAFPEIPQK